MSQKNVNTIESIYRSFAEGDIASVLGAMSEDIEWNEAENFPYADGSPYTGPVEVAEGVFQRLGKEWEYFRLEVERILDAGDTVVTLGRYQAKNRETHREIDAQFVHVWDFEDEKIKRFQQYTDTKQVAHAYGRITV